jgi:hypothetical protein
MSSSPALSGQSVSAGFCEVSDLIPQLAKNCLALFPRANTSFRVRLNATCQACGSGGTQLGCVKLSNSWTADSLRSPPWPSNTTFPSRPAASSSRQPAPGLPAGPRRAPPSVRLCWERAALRAQCFPGLQRDPDRDRDASQPGSLVSQRAPLIAQASGLPSLAH